VVTELGPSVSNYAVGDEVIGFSSRRSSRAEYIAVSADQLTVKPAAVSWDVAGSLYVAGVTAYTAVRSVHLSPADSVAIVGAAGGVGSISVQLAKRTGATVLGIAGPGNDAWLLEHGAIPVNYGDVLPSRLRVAAPSGRIDAMLDFFGGGYVAMAVEELGTPIDRIDTIADFAAVQQFGVQSAGGADASSAAVVAELADLIARGELELPIAGVFPLEKVRTPTGSSSNGTPTANWCCGSNGPSRLRASSSCVARNSFDEKAEASPEDPLRGGPRSFCGDPSHRL
jgi:NADPH:quinone reductase-like Zn-dependent oxidoreductase